VAVVPGPDELTPRSRSADHVQSLERGLAVIRAFDAERRELGLSDVARITGLSRAAARRFLLTLVSLGYVHQVNGRFSLTPRVLELGYAYLSGLSLPEVAQPHMEALVAAVNESSSVSVLDDLEIVYVARVPTRRIMSITLAVGTRLPAFATSMGRVLLAELGEAELEERLARIEFQPLTAYTVRDAGSLREILARVRAGG
jgi:IclR family pca regulon transcriptional regulator